MSIYLVIKEIWRNKSRFILVSLVIALITTLVLFIAALAEGLGSGNKEYIEKLNADLIVFQEDTDLSVSASRVGRSKINDIRRVEGVKEVGPIGFSTASIVFADPALEPLDISLIGAEPGKPGEPPAFEGRNLRGTRSKEAIIDKYTALRAELEVGDEFTVKTIQGTKEEFYTLQVVGITDGRQYFIQPSIVVPYLTWEKIKSKASFDENAELASNIVGVQLDNPQDLDGMKINLETQVSGIEAADRVTTSPTGAETEGWLITVGGTPKQMLAHTPEFTYKRLLQAARMAKRMGAQIMGLGAFTKVVGDAGVTVARKADIPITTGNSYSASGALWAGADAVRRMGLIKVEKGKKIKGKTMVLGATGAIGSVCCRLLAKAFDEVYLAGRNTAKLLSLEQSIREETPGVKTKITTNPDKYLGDMDVIVTATSGAGKTILDITKVKPGCVITDVARPLDLSPEDVAKRPDVLVIESGEIELPGNPEMKSIGLPHKVAYACLAETIVLALEGRYEIFTIGRDIEWEKVRTIYKLGLKHGMKLAAISGVNGVFSDEDIAKVKKLALKARKKANKAGGKKA